MQKALPFQRFIGKLAWAAGLLLLTFYAIQQAFFAKQGLNTWLNLRHEIEQVETGNAALEGYATYLEAQLQRTDPKAFDDALLLEHTPFAPRGVKVVRAP